MIIDAYRISISIACSYYEKNGTKIILNGTVIGMLFLVHWIEREILSKNINVGQTSATVVMDGLYWNVWSMAITYVDIWLLCDKISSERIEMYNNIGVIWQPGKLGQQQPVQVYLYIETICTKVFLS